MFADFINFCLTHGNVLSRLWENYEENLEPTLGNFVVHIEKMLRWLIKSFNFEQNWQKFLRNNDKTFNSNILKFYEHLGQTLFHNLHKT